MRELLEAVAVVAGCSHSSVAEARSLAVAALSLAVAARSPVAVHNLALGIVPVAA